MQFTPSHPLIAPTFRMFTHDRRAWAGAFGLLILVLWAVAATAQDAPLTAGEVVLTVGDARVVRTDGRQERLARGDAVYRGDTVTTENNARVQVLFTDGSRMSIRPGSDVDLSDYSYDPGVASNNRFRMRLRRGGFRTETGGIGRLNRAGYRIDMPMSTIGVRGTVFGAGVVDEGDAVGTSQGTVEQTTGSGGLETGPDSDFLYSVVTDPNRPPEGRTSPPGNLGDVMNLDLPLPTGGLPGGPGGAPGEGDPGAGEDGSDAEAADGDADAADGEQGESGDLAAGDDAPEQGDSPPGEAGEPAEGGGQSVADGASEGTESTAGSGGTEGELGAGGPGDIDVGNDSDSGDLTIGGEDEGGGIEVPQFDAGAEDDGGAEPLFQFGKRCL